MRPAALGLALLALAACGPRDGGRAPRASETCTRLGDRCALPDGPLGICVDVTELGNCDAPPCLVCQSQH
jgi:hypothetical protein